MSATVVANCRLHVLVFAKGLGRVAFKIIIRVIIKNKLIENVRKPLMLVFIFYLIW